MNKKLLNDTSEIIVRYLQAELRIPLVKTPVKALIAKIYCIYIVSTMLGVIIERVVLAICLDKTSLAIVLGRTSWVVTEYSLWYFGTRGLRIHSLPLNIPNRFFGS